MTNLGGGPVFLAREAVLSAQPERRAHSAEPERRPSLSSLRGSDFKIKRLQSVCASEQCKLETLWLSVTGVRGRRFNVCAVYRPPCNSSVQVSTDLNCPGDSDSTSFTKFDRPSYHRWRHEL